MRIKNNRLAERIRTCTCFAEFWFTLGQQKQAITTLTSTERESGMSSMTGQLLKSTCLKLSRVSALEEASLATLICSFMRKSSQPILQITPNPKSLKEWKFSRAKQMCKLTLTRLFLLKLKKAIMEFSFRKFQNTTIWSSWWLKRTCCSSRNDSFTIIATETLCRMSFRSFGRPKLAIRTKLNSINSKNTCCPIN